MARLELRDVTKIYPGGVKAVDRAAIDIRDGEFVVLVGPSGCGKSTLLRMIAGLETVTEGEIAIGGRVVNRLEPGERDIAMVFQNYALYPHMSVRQNMSYGLRNQGMNRADIEKRIAAAADILQLGELLDRRPRELSGGQRQRVAMGRAIVREPEAFLLDEPLSNLDTKLRAHMRGEIKVLHDRLGATFIHVTHDQVEAMSLADRIVVMNAGRIEQIGPPREVYDRPASRFVAEFIGAPPMNFMPGARVGHPAPWVGVRPESLLVVAAGTPAPEGGVAIAARLLLVEDLGADRFLHLAPEGVAAEEPLVARADIAADFVAGQAVTIAAEARDLRLFDEQGRALA